MTELSRRAFVEMTAGSAVAAPFVLVRRVNGAAVTAQAIVDRIRSNIGTEWKAGAVDTFKAGDPATVVTGIVTTALPTLDVLKRVVTSGANLVIAYEPTFYSRADSPTPPPRRGGGPGSGRGAGDAPPAAPDPVFAAKDEFIKKNNLVVFRFSENWRAKTPDPLAIGLSDALGWAKARRADDPARATIPERTLDAIASQVKQMLASRGGIRVVGDPLTKIKTIGLLPGSTPIQAALKMMPTVDLVIGGEVREWETVEYARDFVTDGGKKGLILIGRIVSEDPGMKVCAQWLKTLVPEVPTTWIPVTDPYWRPL
jgi:putative NIF3 family GTP cyclohydrolase 1 type 2